MLSLVSMLDMAEQHKLSLSSDELVAVARTILQLISHQHQPQSQPAMLPDETTVPIQLCTTRGIHIFEVEVLIPRVPHGWPCYPTRCCCFASYAAWRSRPRIRRSSVRYSRCSIDWLRRNRTPTRSRPLHCGRSTRSFRCRRRDSRFVQAASSSCSA